MDVSGSKFEPTPPIANRTPSRQTAVEHASGVSGNECHGDGVGGAVATAGREFKEIA